MSNLIPEQRLDKNNRLVTRHVKPHSGTKSSALEKSSPVPTVTPEGEEFSQSLGMRMDSLFLQEKGISPSEVMKSARRLPSQTALILDKLLGSENVGNTLVNLYASALHHGESVDTLENMAVIYSDYQYQEYDWDEANGMAGEHTIILEDIRGIQQLEAFAGVTNFQRADHRTRELAVAVDRMLELAQRADKWERRVTDDGEKYTAVTDTRLIDLLVDHPDEIGEVLDLAYEHDADADLILSKMNTTKPLRDGVL